MFTHVHLGSNDTERSRRFYDAIFAAIGGPAGVKDPERNRYFYQHDGAMLIVGEPIDGEAATPGNGMTIGFKVASPEQGDAWYKAGVDNGGTGIEEAPGIRKKTVGMLYLAYMRDPDGNKLCAMKRMEG
ncbi:hypothetical protein GCM10011371_00360 [Novosphingobium marinum]|uniref:Catechol 2,3-dioxygenase-like lactoylglutathione lyase family enzyme n=1 Tax=Novosphingobium marinum TaxID=1514948 RepID=A0A7Y9XUZ8_9SPHN|nr:VOC family protein [Novosphingobium marinum]NYH93728.1 catechol 2,3-dioxygenase-like lactoylglutathione lyase family enzyme [Novosphingobium marinum]GGC16854.1 hypothetical protein GCM10011371_00360 [Novosphingobium marinum]